MSRREKPKTTYVVGDDHTGKATLFKGMHHRQALRAWREGKTALVTARGMKKLLGPVSLEDYEEQFITVKKLVK